MKIDQKFGSWLKNVRVTSDGEVCRIHCAGRRVSFGLATVSRVLVSTPHGFLVPKGTRRIHLLGAEGELAFIDCTGRPGDAQAAASFVRHLIHESKRPLRAGTPQAHLGSEPFKDDQDITNFVASQAQVGVERLGRFNELIAAGKREDAKQIFTDAEAHRVAAGYRAATRQINEMKAKR